MLPAMNPGPMTGEGNRTWLIAGARTVLVDAGVGRADAPRGVAARSARRAGPRSTCSSSRTLTPTTWPARPPSMPSGPALTLRSIPGPTWTGATRSPSSRSETGSASPRVTKSSWSSTRRVTRPITSASGTRRPGRCSAAICSSPAARSSSPPRVADGCRITCVRSQRVLALDPCRAFCPRTARTSNGRPT